MKGLNMASTSGLLERYGSFSLRERALIAGTLLVVTWVLWAGTVGGYLDDSKTRLRGAVSSVDQRLDAARAERARLQAALAADPNARLRREQERLDARLRDMDRSLGDLLARFVDPERMPALLEDVILQHRGLTLTRMESLPAEPMDVSDPAAAADAEATPVRIYRHPLRLEFEGGYFDVMAYLEELESGPWQFGWRHLHYEVRDHPVAKVTLEIETLSRDKNWIGV